MKSFNYTEETLPGVTDISRELLEKIMSRKAKVGIVGLGYVGLPLAAEFARQGFPVTGIDLETTKIEEINGGKSYIGDVPSEEIARLVEQDLLRASSDFNVLAELDTINICVPTPLRKTKDPDLSYILAAVGYAAESGLPFKFGLIRNHYVGRTFIEPEQNIRDFGVKLKLNPVRSVLDGQRVVLVDDSIVRGTTSRKIVRIIRQGGAREVHVRVSCPPTVAPCFYGIDTPTQKELIASHNSVEEIRKFIGADSLAYLSLDGLREAVADTRGEFCTACYTGQYPTKLVNMQMEAASRR